MNKILQKWFSSFLCIALCAVLLAGCTSTDSADKGKDENKKNEETTVNESGTDGQQDQDNNQDENQTDDSEQGGNDSEDPDHYTVAISMPQQSDRWKDDAANMERGLKAIGYEVITRYADNDVKQQAAQVQELAGMQPDCMVIAPADPAGLAEAVESAAAAGIPVISYDLLLMDTDAVSFYTAFDSSGAGILIGQAIIEKAGLDSLSDGEYRTIEFFMGDAKDRSAKLLYKGLMEALEPYLDQGTLVCKSGRTSMKETAVAKESQIKAQKRCADTLAKYYADEDLDICAAASDILSYGCQEAFKASGYTVENWPLISGQNCELEACGNILEGTQSFSIYKDTRELALKCVSMIEALLSGMEPEINDVEQYDNHVLTVPAYVCTPIVVDADNLEETLVEGGFYTKEQIDSVRP
ncbi:MAG: sugar ABC transporter substrate-binding protein [Eubacterium sp.]|nr:sugar ABC transporter substrate-binding protein [Eubacterium sp.]MCI8918153.1 sugar ABC transporter substrate-binding protein [Eubacterium sp.]